MSSDILPASVSAGGNPGKDDPAGSSVPGFDHLAIALTYADTSTSFHPKVSELNGPHRSDGAPSGNGAGFEDYIFGAQMAQNFLQG